MIVSEHSKKFMDMLTFIAEAYTTESMPVTHYVNGLTWDNEMEIKHGIDLDQAVIATHNMEDVHKWRSQERQPFTKKCMF